MLPRSSQTKDLLSPPTRYEYEAQCDEKNAFTQTMTTMNNDGGGGLSSRVVSVIGYHIVLASISVSPCSMMPFIYPGIIVEVKSRCCYFLFDDGRHIVSCEGELNVFPWPNARDKK